MRGGGIESKSGCPTEKAEERQRHTHRRHVQEKSKYQDMYRKGVNTKTKCINTKASAGVG